MFKHLFCGILLISTFCFFACSDPNGDDDLQDGATKTITAGGTSIEVVYVAPGKFTMGVEGITVVEDDELQVNLRDVTLTKGFWISKYPITQSQYEAVMDTNPARYFDRIDNKNHPVERVTWYNASGFAQKVGGRLPTEAEWEFAARGGSKSKKFTYSGSNNIDDVAWYFLNLPDTTSGSEGRSTQPVGKKLPNELGIYDMSGNVWEWVNDWWSDFGTAAVTDPKGPAVGDKRVIKGGCWWFKHERYNRVGSRFNDEPDASWLNYGFRIVFDVRWSGFSEHLP